jgi:hypothetical protein
MLAPPAFAESTILKALFRTLAFAVIIEALFNRLVTIPAQSVSRPWVESLHASTGRAGDLMFVLSFALLLPTLLAIAYASMRAGAGSLHAFVAVGVILSSS